MSLALLFPLAGCHRSEPAAPPPQTVQAGEVEEIIPDMPQRYSATILPENQVDMAFKSAGLVEKVNQVRGADGRMRDVGPGDKVSAGTELATVRPLDYEQQVTQNEAGVRQAQAQLAEANAAFAHAELDYTRAKNLFSSASLIKPDLDQAQARYDTSKAQVQAAEAALENNRIRVSQARLTVSDTVLRAPFTGYVTARNISKGSLVGNATVGFSLIDTHVVKAEFGIPGVSLSGIHLGQRLAVTIETAEPPARGVVTAISPQADPKSRVFAVDVTISNSDGKVRPGMIGSVSLTGSTGSVRRLTIPISAVVRAASAAEGFAVFRIEKRDNKTYAAAQSIQTGNTYGNSIEVTRGVSKGDRIVALGGELLRNGQEVRVLP